MNKNLYEKKIIQDIIYTIVNKGGKKYLSSIILTGSFGRGEPTFEIGSDGKIQLKSDVEIALIFSKSLQKRVINNFITSITKEFEEDLNLMAINEKRIHKVFNFNFTLIEPKYKTIFTYDLFNGSKTIWGNDLIGKIKVPLESIDLYEAKRLVANRIGELIYLQSTTDTNQKKYLKMQWKGKLMLAIVSAWLICKGEYVSSYHGQFNKIMNSRREIEKQLGSGFFDEYGKTFRFLRESGEAYETSDEILKNYVHQIDILFKKLDIRKPKINSFSRLMKYRIKYLKTDMKYGLYGFENCILQSLISDYYEGNPKLYEDAKIWHIVLY